MKSWFVWLLASVVGICAAAEDAQTLGGEVWFRWHETALERLAVRASTDRVDLRSIAGLDFAKTVDGLRATNGHLDLVQPLELQAAGKHFAIERIVPLAGTASLQLLFGDAQGDILLQADFPHSEQLKPDTLELRHFDLYAGQDLAAALGNPELAGFFLGSVGMQLRVVAQWPKGECAAPWPDRDNPADIALVGMPQVREIALNDPDLVAVSPSALLENVGVAAVPWYEQFDPPAAPYGNDQHPYLVWSLYRLHAGRLEQLGVSPVKHAFFTVNDGCPCAGGHIIYPGCRDLYSASTNDLEWFAGPRSEIDPATGIWQRDGSIFDPNGDGIEDPAPRSSPGAAERRLVVAAEELRVEGARYFVQAWYVVRDDVNIFNSMGFVEVRPTETAAPLGSVWNFPLEGAFAEGPVLVSRGGELARVQTSEGQWDLAVLTERAGAGHRLEYRLFNWEVARGLREIEIPLSAEVGVEDVRLYGPSSDDFAVDINNQQLRLDSADGLGWGEMLTIELRTAVGAEPGSVLVDREQVETLIPALFGNGFE